MTERNLDLGTDDLRTVAVRRLRKKSDFVGHLRAYLVFSAFLALIWAIGGGGYYWPAIPMTCWGIWVIVHAASLVGSSPVTEQRVRAEIERMRAAGW